MPTLTQLCSASGVGISHPANVGVSLQQYTVQVLGMCIGHLAVVGQGVGDLFYVFRCIGPGGEVRTEMVNAAASPPVSRITKGQRRGVSQITFPLVIRQISAYNRANAFGHSVQVLIPNDDGTVGVA